MGIQTDKTLFGKASIGLCPKDFRAEELTGGHWRLWHVQTALLHWQDSARWGQVLSRLPLSGAKG